MEPDKKEPKQANFPHFNKGGYKKGLTLKEKMAVAEYLKTGKKGAAYISVYKANKKNLGARANTFFRKPKIISAIEKALKDNSFDDQYAVKSLKSIVEGGMQNIDITRPDTALKALETFWKLTGKLGTAGNQGVIKPDPESLAKKMDITQLQQELKLMDKKQKRILAIISGKAVEGEIIK